MEGDVAYCRQSVGAQAETTYHGTQNLNTITASKEALERAIAYGVRMARLRSSTPP